MKIRSLILAGAALAGLMLFGGTVLAQEDGGGDDDFRTPGIENLYVYDSPTLGLKVKPTLDLDDLTPVSIFCSIAGDGPADPTPEPAPAPPIESSGEGEGESSGQTSEGLCAIKRGGALLV